MGKDGNPIRGGFDLRVADGVVGRRAGDVIPQVVSIIMDKRRRAAKPYKFPDTCPVCGSHAVREEDEAVRRRTRARICPARAGGRGQDFLSRPGVANGGGGGKKNPGVFQGSPGVGGGATFSPPKTARRP